MHTSEYSDTMDFPPGITDGTLKNAEQENTLASAEAHTIEIMPCEIFVFH